MDIHRPGIAVAAVAAAGMALILLGTRRRAQQRAAPGHIDGMGAKSGEPYTLQPRPIVLLLGDSITQQASEPSGWGAALTAAYAHGRNADVLNRGFSGYNSRLLCRVVPTLLSQIGGPLERVALVTLLIGSNDATRPGAEQHVPVAEFAANVGVILATLRSALPNARVVVVTPPAVDESGWRKYCEKTAKGDGDGRSNERLAPYVLAAKTAAERHGALVVDLHARSLATAGWPQRLLSDGLHLSAGGNKLAYELISETIISELTAVAPGNLPWHMPRWNDVRAI